MGYEWLHSSFLPFSRLEMLPTRLLSPSVLNRQSKIIRVDGDFPVCYKRVREDILTATQTAEKPGISPLTQSEMKAGEAVRTAPTSAPARAQTKKAASGATAARSAKKRAMKAKRAYD